MKHFTSTVLEIQLSSHGSLRKDITDILDNKEDTNVILSPWLNEYKSLLERAALTGFIKCQALGSSHSFGGLYIWKIKKIQILSQ